MAPKWVDNLEEAVKTSRCCTQALKKLGLSPTASGNHQTFKKWTAHLNIDTSHFEPQKVAMEALNCHNFAKRYYSQEDVFVLNGMASKSVVKRWLRKVLPRKCFDCGITTRYNGKPIVLQMDHINGDPRDDRLENLRWACPNCHSQTPTWSNKRHKKPKKPRGVAEPRATKIQWPDAQQLAEDVKELGYDAVGKGMGVSGNAVKKHLAKHGIKLPRYNTP